MDYSTWLSSTSSLDVSHGIGNTLRLLDDSPVRDCVKKVQVPTSSCEVASTPWVKHEAGALMEELNRVNAENKKLAERLTTMCEEYNDLKRKLMDYVGKSFSDEVVGNAAKRTKMENYLLANRNHSNSNNNKAMIGKNTGESSSSDEEDSCQRPKAETIKAKITRVAIRTEASDSTLIFKDGYQWRKYGQKVTRDNPCPRAYFKCSFAPSCPVKKKVQRNQEDQTMLVATYEGDHNHAPPPNQETSSASSRGFTLDSNPYNNTTTLGSSCPSITLDLTKPKTSHIVANHDTTKSTSSNGAINTTLPASQVTKFSSPEFQKLLAEQMASSLTKDPNFTAALAAAISGRFSPQ